MRKLLALFSPSPAAQPARMLGRSSLHLPSGVGAAAQLVAAVGFVAYACLAWATLGDEARAVARGVAAATGQFASGNADWRARTATMLASTQALAREDEQTTIVDRSGRVLAQSAQHLVGPAITGLAALRVDGVEVGEVRTTRSAWPALRHILAAALAALLLAVAARAWAWWLLRRVRDAASREAQGVRDDAQARWAMLFERSGDALIFCTPTGQVVSCNEAASRRSR